MNVKAKYLFENLFFARDFNAGLATRCLVAFTAVDNNAVKSNRRSLSMSIRPLFRTVARSLAALDRGGTISDLMGTALRLRPEQPAKAGFNAQ
ncbi:hypothetical protein [Roseomonas sp. 18066]|uniref:hypothetical protein n=1 Tax=Roseomonas sp. 18066 TaxID=2681412 RepID=UPI00135AB8B7|nr:hypothetical protein [Roseomonas sp. 18066]